MPKDNSRARLWTLAHTERAALADDLATLTDDQWAHQTLCGRWTVEEVVAHLTAAASTGRFRWIASVLSARFDFDKHNDRRLAENRGATPAETLARCGRILVLASFRSIIPSTTAASGHTAAWLGEVVVQAQDIRQPLGVTTTPSVEAATDVARFFATTNFTVPSKKSIDGLRLEATDGPFAAGTGPLVTGTTVALVMVMAGRVSYCDDLGGAGVTTLRDRVAAAAASAKVPRA
ncbi:maleylpyruvate isomerase family mycothiol-dependent enzyme [Nocardia farcinica]|uniref:maleylpyruvate isomerase family mycothiol-dependent enzyme n=1 Tax=Nocardia farcinica TaxID=37329 RepID=UPI001B3C5B07|nr:maleylpyruvate isomerase family mycothiol-dependent enzyme [Nocardia farcinica]MBF6535593.1 maleylpyruvate isomerase family mycothiol-dependent enzyme [Nocardia farcinica]